MEQFRTLWDSKAQSDALGLWKPSAHAHGEKQSAIL